jgi:OOP family OmpA-OmpF porin
LEQPSEPEAKPALPEKEALPPKPAPKPPPAVELPPPKSPAPVVPPAVVAAIEDLGQKYPGLFVFDKEKGLFRFNSDITFDSGSSVVKPEARAALMKLAEILNGDQARDRVLTIVGHTDNVPVRKRETVTRLKALGKSADNMGLSEARAEAVADVLRAGGIDAARMVTQGKGQNVPMADNRTAEGKAKNRRVEIYLTPGSAAAGGGAAPPRRTAFPSGN